jgi:hypothetical protein
MKNVIRVIVIAIFVLSTSTLIIANDPPKKRLTYEQIEKTLLYGLNSDNLGLQISCSFMLGEIKSKNAIPELTAIINNVDNDKARLTAILALLKIASNESLVKLNQNEQNKEITQLCERLVSCHNCLVGFLDPQEDKEEVSLVSE